jgi:hypothetical protein
MLPLAVLPLTAPVIVGTSYSKDARTVERRIYELSPRAERYDVPGRPNGVPRPKLGGGEDLLETIERDIKPRIAELCGEKPSTTTLFGQTRPYWRSRSVARRRILPANAMGRMPTVSWTPEIRCFTNMVALILAILTAALPMWFIDCWCEVEPDTTLSTT